MPPYCSFSVVYVFKQKSAIVGSRFFQDGRLGLYSLTRFLKQKLYKNTKKVNIISLYLYQLASTIWTSLIRFYHCNIRRKMILTQICRAWNVTASLNSFQTVP